MEEWISIFLLGLFLAASLSGCAGFTPKDDSASVPPPKMPVKAKVETAEPPRYLGSLWTDGSKWNDLYSSRAGRTAGDMIILNPSDSFRMMVAERAGKTTAVEVLNSDRENSHLVARIKEVLSHSVYLIEAKQTLKVGNRNHEIQFLAKMREQDIAPDDTSTTDALFDLDLTVESDTPTKDKEKTALVAKTNDATSDKNAKVVSSAENVPVAKQDKEENKP